MASFAGQTAWEALPGEVRRLARAVMPEWRDGVQRGASSDMRTARALATVGAAALIGLPVLMLASLLLHAPLAAPPAIALGYLATARALALHDPRQAALWTVAVLSGLTGWTLIYPLTGEHALSGAGLVAVLLAPLFAAAPALVRRLGRAKADAARNAALADIDCIEALAPGEAILVLDGNGRLLAGSRAGLKALRLAPGAAGTDVTRLFEMPDRPIVLDALRACRTQGCSVDTLLRLGTAGGAQEQSVGAKFSAGRNGAVTMRVRLLGGTDAETCASTQGRPRPVLAVPLQITATSERPLAGDIAEALQFALRHAAPAASAKRLEMICDTEPRLTAACDRQTCRQILSRLVEAAIVGSAVESGVSITARRVRGVVLLRATYRAGDTAPAARLCGTLAELVDQAGGTLMIEESNGGTSVSVRLASTGAERGNLL